MLPLTMRPRRSPTFPSTKCRPARRDATSATVPMRTCRQMAFGGQEELPACLHRAAGQGHHTGRDLPPLQHRTSRRLQGTFPLYGGYCGVPAGWKTDRLLCGRGGRLPAGAGVLRPAGKAAYAGRVHDRRTNPDTERPFLSDRQEPGTDGGRRVWIPPPVGGRQVSYYGKRHKGLCIPAQQEAISRRRKCPPSRTTT